MARRNAPGCPCCKGKKSPCPPNCTACNGVNAAPDGGTACAALGISLPTYNWTGGTVSDASGTYPLCQASYNGIVAQRYSPYGNGGGGGTFCPAGSTAVAGPKKDGVKLYFQNIPDQFTPPGPCGGSPGTLYYMYEFACGPGDQVSLFLLACIFACFTDNKVYYLGFDLNTPCRNGPGSPPIAFHATATPTCSGDKLTATFDFSGMMLSGGQPPPVSSATVEIPLGGDFFCNQQFKVLGCNGLPLAGATVTVSGIQPPAYGTSTSLAGQTALDGTVCLSWFSGCKVTVQVDGGTRLVGYGPTALDLSKTTTTTITLSPASGFTCLAGCAGPARNTLNATYLVAGPQTFVQDGTNWVASFAFGGHNYRATISQGAAYAIMRDGVACAGASMRINNCPTAGPSLFMATLDSGSCGGELGLATVTG